MYLLVIFVPCAQITNMKRMSSNRIFRAHMLCGGSHVESNSSPSETRDLRDLASVGGEEKKKKKKIKIFFFFKNIFIFL